MTKIKKIKQKQNALWSRGEKGFDNNKKKLIFKISINKRKEKRKINEWLTLTGDGSKNTEAIQSLSRATDSFIKIVT